MRKSMLVLIISVIGSFASAQQFPSPEEQEEANAEKSQKISEIHALRLDLSAYSVNIQGEIKDELIGYYEKIVSVQLNESNSILEIQYTSLFNLKELTAILKNYGIYDNSVILSD